MILYQTDRKVEKTLEDTSIDVMKNKMSKFILMVTTIITTVTFAATFQVPAGYNDNGLAVLGNKKDFKSFRIFDSLAFGFSLASMSFHFIVQE